jgi:hypothetical protein
VRNVHSLNARDNGLLPWVFARSNNDPGQFRDNIQRDLDQLVTMLRSRQVAYSDLKSALVPPQDGRQVVFLYDWLNDPSWNYAVEFSKYWLPVLRKTLRTSVRTATCCPRIQRSVISSMLSTEQTIKKFAGTPSMRSTSAISRLQILSSCTQNY